MVLVVMSNLFFSGYALAKHVIVKTSSGGVNWSDGVVYAIGYGPVPDDLMGKPRGRLVARRIAMVDAYRNLAEITQGVRVTSEKTIGQSIQQNLVIKTKVDALIKGAEVVTEKFAGGMFSIKMAMPIGGKLLHTLMPRETFQKIISQDDFSLFYRPFNLVRFSVSDFFMSSTYAANVFELDYTNQHEMKTVSKIVAWLGKADNIQAGVEQLKLQLKQYEAQSNFTGVILDVSDIIDFEMATVPRIKTSTGRLIYPNKNTDYNQVIKNRLVSYDFDLQDAVINPRVSKKPIVIKAKGLYKSKKSDIIISEQDAATLHRVTSIKQNLNKARVMIIVSE